MFPVRIFPLFFKTEIQHDCTNLELVTRDFPLLSIFAAASAAYKKPSDIFMSVGVFPGEMLLDPGATLAFGSTTAWHDLDQALHRVLGYGFTISPSCQQFRSANGKVDTAIQDFSIGFPTSVNGVYKMYRFQGSSADCGKYSNAQTPILFSDQIYLRSRYDRGFIYL